MTGLLYSPCWKTWRMRNLATLYGSFTPFTGYWGYWRSARRFSDERLYFKPRWQVQCRFQHTVALCLWHRDFLMSTASLVDSPAMDERGAYVFAW